jgi:hypothetical protein
MNYLNPRESAAMPKDYTKKPDRTFKLKQDLMVPAGTLFHFAALERGGIDRVEAVVGIGSDTVAWLNLPLRVAEIDAPNWFEEVVDDKPV